MIATPIVATIGFLYMSTVIKEIGLVATMSQLFGPFMQASPVIALAVISTLTALFTQSYGASASVLVPMLQVTMGMGADPFAACFAAAGTASLMQYFLTGGPVAALATVIPAVPGCNLKDANLFQRPAILSGVAMSFLITILLTVF